MELLTVSLAAAALASVWYWRRQSSTADVDYVRGGDDVSDINRPSSPSWSPPPAAAPFLAAIAAAERQNGIPDLLLARLLDQESSYRPDVIDGTVTSSAGAVGIAQLVPRWHPNVNPRDPWASIPYAAHYLREQFDRFGSWAKALAAYNVGPTRLAREAGSPLWLHRLPFETQHYVREILTDVPIEEMPA